MNTLNPEQHSNTGVCASTALRSFVLHFATLPSVARLLLVGIWDTLGQHCSTPCMRKSLRYTEGVQNCSTACFGLHAHCQLTTLVLGVAGDRGRAHGRHHVLPGWQRDGGAGCIRGARDGMAGRWHGMPRGWVAGANHADKLRPARGAER